MKRGKAKVIVFRRVVPRAGARPRRIASWTRTGPGQLGRGPCRVGEGGRQCRDAGRCRRPGSEHGREQRRRRGTRRRISLGPAIEERPVVNLPYDALAAAAAGFGHNVVFTDSDGPARRIAAVHSEWHRYMPSLGVAAALAYGGYKPEDVTLDGDALRDRGSPHSAGVRFGGRCHRSRQTPHAADDADQLSRARARERRAPYPSYGVADLLKSEGADPRRREAARRSRGLQGQDCLHRADRVGPGRRVHRRRSATAPCPASSCTRAWPTASCRTDSSAARPRSARVTATIARRARRSGCWRRSCRSAARGRDAAAMSAAGRWFAVERLRGRPVAHLVAAAGGVALALFAGTAYRYFVEDAREAEGEEAVRPLRLARRLPAADRATRSWPSSAASGAR